MPQRQSQTYRRRRMTNQPSSGSGCIIFVFAVILFVVVLSAIVSNLSSPSGLIFLALLMIGAIAFFIWRHYRKQAQKQQKIAMQQWERIERERQEREKIARLKSLGDILVLTPREFEELTGKILIHNGFRDVHHIGGSGDLGVDLIALDIHGNQVIVQCKRYAPGSAVGSRDIQNFIGMMNVHHKAEKGIFVTTSKFTQPATDLAEEHDILLIDGDRLVRLVQAMQRSEQPH